jgi:hypothetical protein
VSELSKFAEVWDANLCECCPEEARKEPQCPPSASAFCEIELEADLSSYMKRNPLRPDL